MASAMPWRVRIWARPFALCVTVLVAVALVLAPGLPASADPTPAEIENQINDAWGKLEPIVEQYNQVHGQLLANQAKIDVLEKQIAPLQMQVDLAMTRVGAMSAQLYETGPGTRMLALLNSGTPETFAEQMGTLDQLARQQTAQVAATVALRDAYEAQKAPLDQLKAQLAAQDADLANKKQMIEAQLADLQKLRLAAYGAAGQALGNLRPAPCPVAYFGDKGSIAAKRACSVIGKPYVWATSGPNTFDCSGLTLYAWGSVGVALGHFTGWQWTEGKPVARADLRPGDLVFYYPDVHHVAIYVGDGWVVHAPHPGDYVRMMHMDQWSPVAGFRRPG